MSESYRNELDQALEDLRARVKQVAGEHINGLRSRLVEAEEALEEERRRPSNNASAVELRQVYRTLGRVYPNTPSNLLPSAVVNRVLVDERRLASLDREVGDAVKILSDAGFSARRPDLVSQVRNLVSAYENLRSMRDRLAQAHEDLVRETDRAKLHDCPSVIAERDELRAAMVRIQDKATDIIEETQR